VDLLPDRFSLLHRIRDNIMATERYNVDYNAQAVLDLYAERELLIESAAREEIAGFQDHIPALQDSIQKAHDIEQKAWEFLANQLGPE